MTEVMRRASEEREHFDIWNEVPLVPQTTGMSCWAAAAAMLIGWRDCITVDPQAVANGAGRWAAYREGLEPADVPALARAWQLRDEPATRLTIAGLGELLRDRGPLWLGEASPGLHSIVVTGMFGDGSAEHTFVRINDPWPIDRGERYVQPFAELLRNFNAATAVVGEHVQLLHTGGRQRGRSSWRHSQQRRSISVSEKDGGQDRARVHWNHAAERSDRVDVVTRLNQAQQLGSGLALEHRERPTIGLVCPDDPRLTDDEGRGFERWIDESLDQWASALGRPRPHVARMIHACDLDTLDTLDQLLRHRRRRRVCNPEEVHCFGAPGELPSELSDWANERAATDHPAVLRIHAPAAIELPDVDARVDMPTYGTPMGLFQRLQGDLPLGASAAALRGDASPSQTEPEFPSELELIDILADREEQPGRGDAEATQPRWADDGLSVDYRHLARANHVATTESFQLSGRVLAVLAAANRFSLPASGRVLFGLRGCRIAGADDGEFHALVELAEDVPDHRECRCVIGVWDRDVDQVAVFRGSTVPQQGFMRRKANMMLTGVYDYVVGTHREEFHGWLLESGTKIVLRSRGDLTYTTSDKFDRCAPGDHLHPSFSPGSAEFASAGGLTVRGTASRQRDGTDLHRDPDDHTPGWASFRDRLGLGRDQSRPSDDGHRYRMLLLTGREAHVVARERTAASLVRLRSGSRGSEVGQLQQFLARTRDADGKPYYEGTIDDEFGPRCARAWVRWQRDTSGTADAIVSPDDAIEMGFRLV